MNEERQIYSAARQVSWAYLLTATALAVLMALYALRSPPTYPPISSDRTRAYGSMPDTTCELVRRLCLHRQCGTGGELP